MAKEIYCAFGVDVDAVGGWLGSYGGEDSPGDISRGIFAGEIGVPRLVKLFTRPQLPSTWFVPAHSAETFPDEIKMVADAGFEIGAHGYSHENPVDMTDQQERDVLEKSIEVLSRITGEGPKGYTAPWWELSHRTPTLLKEFGFSYDHSQQHLDFVPYYARVGESWSKIDYSGPAANWMKPLEKGESVDIVEIAANWYVDDLPPMMFIKASPNSHGFVNPRDIEEMWRDQFDWVYRELDYATFTLTVHPDVSGRPQVLLMLERLIEHISGHDGVKWVTFNQIADDFRLRYPFESDERPAAW